jgi:hypothetical protein
VKEYAMRKHILGIGIPAVALAAVLLAVGCSSDDDGGNQPAPCSIEIYGPTARDVFTVPPQNVDEDLIVVRWNAAGGGEVMLELFKGETLLGVMEDAVPNDGSQHWRIDPLVNATGSDYNVKVTSLDDASCTDTSAEFTIRDLEGCTIGVDIDYPGIIVGRADAGDTMTITWTGTATTGNYDVELWWAPPALADEYIGTVAEFVPGPSLEWPIDSLNRGDSWYKIVVRDNDITTCFGASEDFEMLDPDVCGIEILAPQSNDPLPATVDILWQATNTSGLVDIDLYYGLTTAVGEIAHGLNAAEGGTGILTWTVTDFGRVFPSRTNYRIRIRDADDQYCFDYSGNLTIADTP